MLAFVESNLHLGHDVPIRSCGRFKITIDNKLRHRCPDAAKAVVLRESFAHSRPKERGARHLVCVRGEFCACLNLGETGAGETLAKSGKSLEYCNARPQRVKSITGRCIHLALKAE